MKLQPMDVVVVDGLWYMPHHWLIRWRSFDPGVHCITVSADGSCWSPEFSGIIARPIDYYKGRRLTIHRFKGDTCTAFRAAIRQAAESRGYDFRQWLFGGILGVTKKSWVEGSKQYTCSEFPYWAFQDTDRITPKDDVLPLPRLFRYHPQFETIFDGVWG